MSNYDEALDLAKKAWALSEKAAMGVIALAILALVDELQEHRDAKDRPNPALKEKREDGSVWVINPDNGHDAICVHRAGDEP